MNDKFQKLDNNDYKIIFELDKNARIPTTLLAKKLKITREIVKYRINKLVSQNTIKNFTTIINPSKLGYILCKLYLKLQNTDKEKENEIMGFLNKHNKVFWLARCDGIYDIIVGVYVNNLVEFNEIINDFMGRFSQNILSKEISNSVYIVFYRRNYLTYGSSESVLWGGTPKKEYVDDLGKRLLKLIAENSRETIVELSKKLNTTPKKVMSRLSHLEKKRIILGYRVNLNLRNIGREYFKAIIKFQNITKEKEEAFKKYCKQHPNICYYIRTIASWDVELDIEIDSFEKFNELIREIKERYGDIIRTIDNVFVSEEPKGELNVVQVLQ